MATNEPGLTVTKPRDITEGLRTSTNIEDRRDDRNYDLRDRTIDREELEDRQGREMGVRKPPPHLAKKAKIDPTETTGMDLRDRMVVRPMGDD